MSIRISSNYEYYNQIIAYAANTLGWCGYRLLVEKPWMAAQQVRPHQPDVLGTVKNVTVSASCEVVRVDLERARNREPIPPGDSIGIDLGLARYATLSDDRFYAPLSRFKWHQDSLRKAQQAMSCKQRFSNNWKKAKSRIQICGRYHQAAGQKRSGQIWPELIHPRPGVV